MKSRIALFLLLISSFAFAQNFEDRWRGHFSYISIKDISHGNDAVYVAAENALFVYDLFTEEIKTITTIQGLSGELITSMHYDTTRDLIIVGYETGLINIVKREEDGTYKITKVVDILEKQTIPPNIKRINNFYPHQNKLFISTEYGISVYNLDRLEFGDTYFIGDNGSHINVKQTTILGSTIYAATETDGILRADINDPNIISYQNWAQTTMGNYTGIATLGNDIYAATAAQSMVKINADGSSTPLQNYPSPIAKLRTTDGLLAVTTTTGVYAYGEGFTTQAAVNNVPNYVLDLESGYAFGNKVFLGTKEDGLLIVNFGSTSPKQVLPNGPIKNRPFALDASPGQLWVTFGETSINFNPFPLSKYGVSHLQDTIWNNLSYEQLSSGLAGNPTDLMKVTINPFKPDEAYMSSFQNGLLKFEGSRPSILYNALNSPLENMGDAGIRIFGSDFDRDGNLWFVQSKSDRGLIKLTPDGQFRKVNISNFIDTQRELALTKLAVSREGYVFFGGYYSGVLGYNPSTNNLNKIGENAGSGNLPSANVRALAFDMQNRLWIGTLRGLRVINSPSSFFEAGAPESQAIIIMEDDVPQELLYRQSITAITVDGSNNKWIATASSGVFYVSPNGQETLLRFTKDNSPLPSNNVQDIAIDPSTGVVYFATTQGLVAYKGTATAPKSTLAQLRAFPNPVRPHFNGNVTIDGLTSQANVKITDISGNLVFETTAQGGSIQWDTTAFGRHKVRSGVYLIMVTTEDDSETKVAKVMIVR